MAPVTAHGPEASPQTHHQAGSRQVPLQTESQTSAGHTKGSCCIFPDRLFNFLLRCDRGPKTELCHPTQILSYEPGCDGESGGQ